MSQLLHSWGQEGFLQHIDRSVRSPPHSLDHHYTDWLDQSDTYTPIRCASRCGSLSCCSVIDFYRVQRDAMISSAERWLKGWWQQGGGVDTKHVLKVRATANGWFLRQLPAPCCCCWCWSSEQRQSSSSKRSLQFWKVVGESQVFKHMESSVSLRLM